MSFLQRSLIAFVAMHFSVTSAFAETRTNVGLEAHPNFCNLGGYRTADGRTLQTGMFFARANCQERRMLISRPWKNSVFGRS